MIFESRLFPLTGTSVGERALSRILFVPTLAVPSHLDQTVSLFLPFALLRLITLRPDLVRMRTKKPWVLFLRVLLG